MRNDAEQEHKERRNELQRFERRLLQKEEHLDKKSDSMEKKEDALQRKEDEVTRMQEKIEALHEQKMAELERISGLTYEDAKELLLNNVQTEVKHETAQIIKTWKTRPRKKPKARPGKLFPWPSSACC